MQGQFGSLRLGTGLLLLLSAVTYGIPIGDNDATKTDTRIYTFGVGPNYRGYNLTTESGELMGFVVDIVRKVCEMAQKECAFVKFKDFGDCFDQTTMTGKGLNGRYWDTCPGWINTKQRSLVYSFVGAMTKRAKSLIYVKAGSAITQYDPSTHVTGYNMAFWTNTACMKTEKQWTVTHERQYTDTQKLFDDLRNSLIDVAFTDELFGRGQTGVKALDVDVPCSQRGPSLMMRKDAVNDFAWFESTLQDVIKSPYYKWACNLAKLAYGEDPLCFD